MEDAKDFCCALVTAPNLTVARKLASAALNKKVAACANLVPKIESHYWWNGGIESSTEVLIVFKTTAARVAELEGIVLANHPYDTPEVVTFRLDQGTPKYLAWLAQSTKGE
jgi:periplasmic divalent cation tolerance protein